MGPASTGTSGRPRRSQGAGLTCSGGVPGGNPHSRQRGVSVPVSRGPSVADTHLHETVALGDEAAPGDLLELLTEVGDAGGLQDGGLVMLEEGQCHPEDDLDACRPEEKRPWMISLGVSAWPVHRVLTAPIPVYC